MIEIYSFIIETTRRCNMRCRHCLRGDPENKAMKRKYLDSFLSQVGYISSVTFTGGEPTLPSGMNAICDFMDSCCKYKVDVGGFYIVTNGKVWRPEFATLVNELWVFCSDNEASGIDISGDQFHEP